MTPREQHRASVVRGLAPDAGATPDAYAAFMATWEADMERIDELFRMRDEVGAEAALRWWEGNASGAR